MIRCWLFGCSESDYWPANCRRCGTHMYLDYGWQHGKLTYIADAFRWLWHLVRPRRCEVCGRRLTRTEFCVCDRPECLDSYLPF